MSEATNAVEAVVEEASPFQKQIEKDGTIYELNSFEKGTKFAGFYFYVKSYKDLDSMKAQILAVKPDANPDAIITGLVNTAIAAKMRQKVTAGILPQDEDEIKKRLNKGDILVISLEDAEKFVPGEREPYSESGISKRIKELIDLKKEAKELLATDLAPEDAEKINNTIKAYNDEGKFLLKKLEELRNKTNSMFDE